MGTSKMTCRHGNHLARVRNISKYDKIIYLLCVGFNSIGLFMFSFINFQNIIILKRFLTKHYIMASSVVIAGLGMCYAITQCCIVMYDCMMNYEDFTRTKRTNATSQVNGIASEYF